MGRLFQRRSDPARSEFDEARKILGRLKACDMQTRNAVGAGVQLANADFLRQFTGLESFRSLPQESQRQFCAELSDLELALRNEEPGVALGVGLYRIWLAEIVSGRQNVVELLGEELAELSRRASAT
jgi:hypothetical protein